MKIVSRLPHLRLYIFRIFVNACLKIERIRRKDWQLCDWMQGLWFRRRISLCVIWQQLLEIISQRFPFFISSPDVWCHGFVILCVAWTCGLWAPAYNTLHVRNISPDLISGVEIQITSSDYTYVLYPRSSMLQVFGLGVRTKTQEQVSRSSPK